MVDTEFWNRRFRCLQVHETDTNYRFQFDDSEVPNKYIWIEVSKIGRIDNEGDWSYSLNYMRCNQHLVTAKWFGDWKNVTKTFGDALKKQF
jgi:hypothetical protein